MKDEKVFADAADLELQIDMLENYEDVDKYTSLLICWLKELQHRRTIQTGNSGQVPAGYILVPVDPTMAILDEFDSIIDYGAEDSGDAWRRLLAAAPKEV